MYSDEQQKIDKIISKLKDIKDRANIHEYIAFLEKQNKHLWDVINKDNEMMQSAREAVLSVIKINKEF